MSAKGLDRQGAGERVSSLFRRVISFEAETTGRIRQKSVEGKVFEIAGKEIDSSLDRCLRDDTPPIAENAWLIGEALNALGVHWISGLTALFAAGRLREFVRAVALAVESPEGRFTADDYSTLRQILSEQHWLIFSFHFDLDPEIVPLHVGVNFDNESLVSARVRACCRRSQLSDDDTRTFEWAFIAREKAKRQWLNYNSLRARFSRAFAARESPVESGHRILQALETIVSSNKMGSADKEQTVLELLDSWLAELEEYGDEALL